MRRGRPSICGHKRGSFRLTTKPRKIVVIGASQSQRARMLFASSFLSIGSAVNHRMILLLYLAPEKPFSIRVIFAPKARINDPAPWRPLSRQVPPRRSRSAAAAYDPYRSRRRPHSWNGDYRISDIVSELILTSLMGRSPPKPFEQLCARYDNRKLPYLPCNKPDFDFPTPDWRQ
jgi:hypothetical protein